VRVRKLVLGAAAAAGALVIVTATAFACVSGAAANLSTLTAKPGQEVGVTMRDFRKADPVQVRWNALDGPVLASFDQKGDGNPFQGTFTVPQTASPGNYVVVLTQTTADGKLTQLPVRVALTVTSANGSSPVLGASTAPVEQNRPVGLASADNSVSTASLLLVALGVAGIGMFVVGLVALVASRRGDAPAAARVRG